MKAARINRPGEVQVLDLPDPHPGEQEVVIRVMASGICGTDVHILRGEYMGDYPIVPGHEFAGVVEQVGSAVKRIRPGERVAVEPNIACDNCRECLNNRQNFCLNWQAVGVTRPGGMAERVLAPEKAVIPVGDLPFEQAAFMEPLSCVLHGLERLDQALAERVLVLGAGPVGILLAQGALLRGAAEVTVVERSPARAEFARRFTDRVFNDAEGLAQDSFDAVIDATGYPPLMNRAAGFARRGGKVLLFGVPPAGEKVELDAFAFFRKGLTVLSSFTSRRNSFQAVELLRSGRISVDGLISHRLPLGDLQHGIETVAGGVGSPLKVMIFPPGV